MSRRQSLKKYTKGKKTGFQKKKETHNPDPFANVVVGGSVESVRILSPVVRVWETRRLERPLAPGSEEPSFFFFRVLEFLYWSTQ